jgi:hypothetical protein
MINTSIIKCGHSFCEKCILDIINNSNRCPLCKAPSKKEDVMKNYTLDEIKNEIVKERSIRESENIESKYKEYSKNNEDSKNTGEVVTELHKIFFNNLKDVFNQYENFFHNLDKETNKQIQDINDKVIFQNGAKDGIMNLEYDLSIEGKKIMILIYNFHLTR